MSEPFNERLRVAVRDKNSRLCIGLDLDAAKPSVLHTSEFQSLKQASREIIEATWEHVCGYKLNLAFFERYGSEGYRWLEETVRLIDHRALVIADGKRGDIGNSARFYASSLFGELDADAATVSPYMGTDSIAPFLENPSKGVFVLCRTSNPGGADFQSQPTDQPLFQQVAAWAQRLNANDNIGLVVGATQIESLQAIRKQAPHLPFLMPGVGAQGGSLRAALTVDSNRAPTIIPISRGVLYAGTGSLKEIVAAVETYNRSIHEQVHARL